jgi:hypothetical protein
LFTGQWPVIFTRDRLPGSPDRGGMSDEINRKPSASVEGCDTHR